MKIIKNYFNKLLAGESGGVFKGMLTLLMGAGSARLIGIISIPLLSRIYSPEDYGLLALYTALVAVLAPALTLRYVQAIPLPKSDKAAMALLLVCIKLIFLFSFILAVLLFVFGEAAFSWFSMDDLSHWWWLVILGASGTALYEVFTLWATRKKQYKEIAKTQLTQSLLGNFVKLVLGVAGVKPAGLIAGQFISTSSGITGFLKSMRQPFRDYFFQIGCKKEVAVIKQYRNFAWFRFPSHLLMVVSLQAPVLLVATLYDGGVTGQLGFTLMALSLPLNLIGVSMSHAYYAEVANIGKGAPDKIKRITISVQKKLFAIAIPLSITTFFASEWGFTLAFGEDWRVAGQFASILAPYLLLKFTSSPLEQVLNVIGSQVVFLVISLLRIVGFIAVFFISKEFELQPHGAVGLLSLYMAIYYLCMTIFILYMINKSVKNSLYNNQERSAEF